MQLKVSDLQPLKVVLSVPIIFGADVEARMTQITKKIDEIASIQIRNLVLRV
jgi:hypothetical protein